MKKIRIFSAISLMILSVYILCAGVYAAQIADNTVGAGGTINIPALAIQSRVDAYIGEVETLNTDGTVVLKGGTQTATPNFTADHTTSAENRKWTLTEQELQQLNFDLSGNAIDEQVNQSVTLSFVVTNSSGLTLNVHFTKDGTAVSTDTLSGDLTDDAGEVVNPNIISVALSSADLSAGDQTPQMCVVTIAFSIATPIYLDDTFSFEYGLVIEEDTSV